MSEAITHKAWRVSVPGFNDHDFVHASTASKARYRYFLRVSECCEDLELTEINVHRARERDVELPPLPAAADELTEHQKKIVLHAFGYQSNLEPSQWGYRDHYCTSHADTVLTDLVGKGLFSGPYGGGTGDKWSASFFYLTEAGKSLAMALIGEVIRHGKN